MTTALVVLLVGVIVAYEMDRRGSYREFDKATEALTAAVAAKDAELSRVRAGLRLRDTQLKTRIDAREMELAKCREMLAAMETRLAKFARKRENGRFAK